MFQLIIITGLSGAGKTQAISTFEDMGFFCIDNLPPALLPKFVEICSQTEEKINKVALVIDIRGGMFFDDLLKELKELQAENVPYEILFLEASDEVLVKRFKETRRRHPLAPEGRVYGGILKERERLEELRGQANKIIDTSNLKPSEMKKEIKQIWGDDNQNKSLAITVMSFGYKYGIPMDTDLLIDVRFLPNPFYIQELKSLTGNDQAVYDYVFKSEISREFLRKYSELLKFLIPNYIKEGKTHLVVAIGCTGGQHRSVAIANALEKILQEEEYHVRVAHRDETKSREKK